MPQNDQNPLNSSNSSGPINPIGPISVEEVPQAVPPLASTVGSPNVPQSAIDPGFATIPPGSPGPSSGLPPIVPTAPTPSGGGKKIFAALVGVLFLVGAVGAGIVLVQQNQNPEERAEGIGCLQTTSIQNGCIINKCGFPVQATKYGGPAPNPSASNGGCLGFNQNPENFTLGPDQQTCVQPGCGMCEQIDAAGHGTYAYGGACPAATATATVKPSSTPKATPTATPELSAQCQSVLVYDTDWNLLDSDARSKLKAGDVIRVTIAGTSTSGTIDQARFTFNATLRTPVTAKKPGSEEFFDEITIPSGTTNINIKGELHHPTLEWF